jgi:hypothetical protein
MKRGSLFLSVLYGAYCRKISGNGASEINGCPLHPRGTRTMDGISTSQHVFVPSKNQTWEVISSGKNRINSVITIFPLIRRSGKSNREK